MYYYKVVYTATLNKFALFKIIKAHHLQDANYLFKTFHEGRLGNTRVMSFEGIEKNLATHIIATDIVDKVSPYCWKGKEFDLKNVQKKYREHKENEKKCSKQIDTLAAFLIKEWGDQIGDEGAVDMAIRLLKDLKNPPNPAHDYPPVVEPDEEPNKDLVEDNQSTTAGAPVNASKPSTSLEYPPRDGVLDEQKTEI